MTFILFYSLVLDIREWQISTTPKSSHFFYLTMKLPVVGFYNVIKENPVLRQLLHGDTVVDVFFA